MGTRRDWPFGAALKQHREDAGLSVKAAARRTNKKISDGRWYQLESGVQKIQGQQIPIHTTPATVRAAAQAVGWDINDALAKAGFDPIDLPAERSETPVLISKLPTDDLLAEVRRRIPADDSKLGDNVRPDWTIRPETPEDTRASGDQDSQEGRYLRARQI